MGAGLLGRGAAYPVVLIAVVTSAVLLLASTASAAATHSKAVNGYIYGNDGKPLVGAGVTVNIDGNAKAATTDATGFYAVNFPKNQWTVGSMIYVNATFNSVLATNSTLADDSSPQRVDVHFMYEIPQFGGYPQLLLAGGVLGAISVFFLVRRGRTSPRGSETVPNAKS